MDDAAPVSGDEARALAQPNAHYVNSISLGPIPDETTTVGADPLSAQTVEEHISDLPPEKESTRRLLRTEIIPSNVHDSTALVSTSILAQRRGTGSAERGEVWEDANHFNRATMKAGQYVKIDMGPNQTKRLFLALIGRYKTAGTYDQIMAEIGATVIEDSDVSLLHGREREIIQKLLEHGDGVWDLLEELEPDMLKAVALRKQHEAREKALAEFAEKMDSGEWDEGDWEQFFKDNTWIFGYGLAYRFLTTVQNQANYGGAGLEGTGTERGDWLMGTAADAGFTVLVDIKKPETDLLTRQPYRGVAIYAASRELAGGVSQLQANCATWFSEGSQLPQNVRKLDRLGLHTHEPKGVLVVGRTTELAGDDDRAGSFERFRRLLHNPEIITFDELYERASYLIQADFETAKADIGV